MNPARFRRSVQRECDRGIAFFRVCLQPPLKFVVKSVGTYAHPITAVARDDS